MKIIRKVLIFMLASIMLCSVSCSNKDYSKKTWDTVTFKDKLIERPQSTIPEKYELMKDLNFSRGFGISQFHSNTSGGVMKGYLDYNKKKANGESIWSVGQWGCTKSLTDAEFIRNDDVIKYDDGSKTIEFEYKKSGNINLGIKGSVEYGLDSQGNIRDRVDSTENWPHNIIAQTINTSIEDCNKLIFELEYEVVKCDRLTEYSVDKNLHTAQFQWFITLKNNNPESEGYKKLMWFGFSMFDVRNLNSTPSGMTSYDGGKEDSTGLFIYMFSLGNIISVSSENYVDLPTAIIGQKRKVVVDVVPFIKTALQSAKKHGAMEGTTFNDLAIGSTNIGWEIPGNYDAEVQISGMNMYKIIK